MDDYREKAKTARNRLRGFSLESIVAVVLDRLHQCSLDAVRGLQYGPWLTVLLLKIVLEDKQIKSRSGGVCLDKIFANAIDDLWGSGSPDLLTADNVLIRLRAMMPSQIMFQMPMGFGIMRMTAFINRLEEDHFNRVQFEEKFGISPKSYFFCALFLLACADVGKDRTIKDKSAFQNLPSNLKNDIEIFIDIFSRSLTQHRDMLRGELEIRIKEGRDARDRIEMTEIPWLSKYPLLEIGRKEIIVWSLPILYWCFENAVADRLSEYGQEYSHEFSLIFEEYTLEVLDVSGVSYISDAEFKKGRKNRAISAMDAWIVQDGCNIFIESKMSLSNDAVFTSDDAGTVEKKLKNIKKAILQAWRVGDYLRADADAAKEDYLLVVVNRAVFLGSGQHLVDIVNRDIYSKIYKKFGTSCPQDTLMERLPPNNIIIISIDEFEVLCYSINEGVITFLEFFQKVSEVGKSGRGFLSVGQLFAEMGIKRRRTKLMDEMLEEVKDFISSSFEE